MSHQGFGTQQEKKYDDKSREETTQAGSDYKPTVQGFDDLFINCSIFRTEVCWILSHEPIVGLVFQSGH